MRGKKKRGIARYESHYENLASVVIVNSFMIAIGVDHKNTFLLKITQ